MKREDIPAAIMAWIAEQTAKLPMRTALALGDGVPSCEHFGEPGHKYGVAIFVVPLTLLDPIKAVITSVAGDPEEATEVKIEIDRNPK